MGEYRQYIIKEYIDELEKREMLLDTNVGLAEETSAVAGETVTGLTYNSKEAAPGTLFVCKGAAFKQEYLQEAVSRGAICYVSETPYEVHPDGMPEGRFPGIIVKDIREAMPVLAAKFYCRPWEDLKVIGIGGTKGKSTSAYYMKSIVDEYMKATGGKESAILSSIDVYDGKEFYESHITTPEAMELQQHMRNALDSDIKWLEMEVSSQALKYNRVDEVRLDVGVFMNVSEDHISPVEHADFDDYFSSKMKMFPMCETAVVNLDSEYIDIIMEQATQGAGRVVTFAVADESGCACDAKNRGGANLDFCAYDVRKNGLGIDFRVKYIGTVDGIPESFDEEFSLSMPGFFNVQNAAGVIAAAVSLGIPMEYIKEGLRKARSKGRMETTISKDGKIIAIVDYAHNKLSFEALYSSMKKEYPGCMITGIFGCPGGKAFNRRKELGIVAGSYADRLYLVSEDPGPEPPGKISEEIAQHVETQGCPYEIIDDRGTAIRKAIFESPELADQCEGGAVLLLITGKGDETREKIGTEYVPCESDASYVARFIREYDEKVKD